MEEMTKAAMTAEEWRRLAAHDTGRGDDILYHAVHEVEREFPCDTYAENRHRLAALALHGQPFGFTQEDVAKLRQLDAARKGQSHLSDFFEGVTWNEGFAECHEYGEENVAWLHCLIARIAALLPPKAP